MPQVFFPMVLKENYDFMKILSGFLKKVQFLLIYSKINGNKLSFEIDCCVIMYTADFKLNWLRDDLVMTLKSPVSLLSRKK